VPTPSPGRFRWKASLLRGLHRFSRGSANASPVTVVVPALYNFLPAEGLATGWLNEIDALRTIRQRMVHAAKITGWDVYTFHTLHNLDRHFDTTITTVRDTWVSEGSLSITAVHETRTRFGHAYDYYRVQPRLIENLVFQSSLLDWMNKRAEDVPLRPHVIGTGLLSALVSTSSVSFDCAVDIALHIGKDWDLKLQWIAEQKAMKVAGKPTGESDIGWLRFQEIQKLVNGGSALSLGVSSEHLPSVGIINAPSRRFRYSRDRKSEAVLIETAKDAAAALETLNIASWSPRPPKNAGGPVRGLLVSPLHPAARACRWSFSNYLLATPPAILLFLDHIAVMGRTFITVPETLVAQKSLRLSRMKVTGP
jgi:hypothetical protein